jgi:hypothetical protein
LVLFVVLHLYIILHYTYFARVLHLHKTLCSSKPNLSTRNNLKRPQENTTSLTLTTTKGAKLNNTNVKNRKIDLQCKKEHGAATKKRGRERRCSMVEL